MFADTVNYRYYHGWMFNCFTNAVCEKESIYEIVTISSIVFFLSRFHKYKFILLHKRGCSFSISSRMLWKKYKVLNTATKIQKSMRDWKTYEHNDNLQSRVAVVDVKKFVSINEVTLQNRRGAGDECWKACWLK